MTYSAATYSNNNRLNTSFAANGHDAAVEKAKAWASTVAPKGEIVHVCSRPSGRLTKAWSLTTAVGR